MTLTLDLSFLSHTLVWLSGQQSTGTDSEDLADCCDRANVDNMAGLMQW